MAITLSTNFSKAATSKQSDVVVLVHLWRDVSNYYALSTFPITISTVQYLSVVDDVGSWGESWNITSDNNVASTPPTVTLNQYSDIVGTLNLQGLFGSYAFSGKKLQIYIGYSTFTSLADFHLGYDGYVDSFEFRGNTVVIEGRKNEIPDVDINGAKITWNDGKIGGTAFTALNIPKESDGKFIPVVFGNHWNAPAIPYDLDSSGNLYFATNDYTWGQGITDYDPLKSRVRWNTTRTSVAIFVMDNGYLVPVYELGYAGQATLASAIDSGANRWHGPMVKITNPSASDQLLSDGQIFANVPLRLTYLAQTPTYYQITSHDSDSDLYKVFDRDESSVTYWTFTGDSDNGLHWAEITGILLDLHRNLRTDHRQCVHPLRPIHIPEFKGDLTTPDEYIVLLMARLGHTVSGATKTNSITLGGILVGADGSGVTTCGSTQGYSVQSSPSGTGYNFVSRVGKQNVGGDNVIDFTTDTVGLGDGYVADAGNHGTSTYQSEGALPILSRSALDRWPSFTIRFSCQGTDSVLDVYDVAFEAFQIVDMPLDTPIYTESSGMEVDPVEDNLTSRVPSDTGKYAPERGIQFMELILRKAGVTTAELASEWASAYNTWGYMFSTIRDNSGFVTPTDEPLTAQQLLKEYVKGEPWTVYRDSRKYYRFPVLPFSEWVTTMSLPTYELDHNDFTEFEIGLTPYENIISEIRSLKTDYIYGGDDYVMDNRWKISASESYSYKYYDTDNSYAANRFALDSMEKRYTSASTPSIVENSGKYYSCVMSGTNLALTNKDYWRETSGVGSPSAWSSATEYYGCDAESREIAKNFLNQWCNRHRVAKLKTKRKDYLKYEIGDVVYFKNVPGTCGGITVKGFNGDTSTTGVAVNAQSVSYLFCITSVKRGAGGVSIEAIQLVDKKLAVEDTIATNRNPRRLQPGGRLQPSRVEWPRRRIR